MRRTSGARQGRNRKAGFRLSRISDAVLRRLDKQKCSSIYWASSIVAHLFPRFNIFTAKIFRFFVKEAQIKKTALLFCRGFAIIIL